MDEKLSNDGKKVNVGLRVELMGKVLSIKI